MPATGNPVGADAPNVPTAAQLTQLASLQATAAAAVTSYHNERLTYVAAHKAMVNAQRAVVQYQGYIYGGQKPNVIDDGGATIT
jgi:hypothetical protein